MARRHPAADAGEDNDLALLEAIGRALYGTQWRTDLGEGLGVNRRSVQRWLAGVDRPRPRVWLDLQRLLGEHRARQQELLERLRLRNGTT